MTFLRHRPPFSSFTRGSPPPPKKKKTCTTSTQPLLVFIVQEVCWAKMLVHPARCKNGHRKALLPDHAQ